MNLENKKKIVLDLIGTFQTASKLSLSLRKKGLKAVSYTHLTLPTIPGV